MAGKAEIIDAMSEEAGITKKEAAAAFDAFVRYVSESCQSGDRCAVPGLGTFQVTQRAAREGTNPRTKEKITIPASTNVKFKAGKDLRDQVGRAKARR
ncbi:MAG TPA: HU family DNA-binding protein [Thermoanaerobaculia bacterium]|jgi:DNA-binding protein HU-beta